MKRTVCFLCFIMLMVLAFPIHASDGAATMCTTDATQLQACQTVTVTVTMSGAPDVKSVAYTLQYDKAVFTLLSCDWVWQESGAGEHLDQSTSVFPLEGFDYENGRAVCTFAEPTDINGNTFVFRLKVKQGAPLGTTRIGVAASLMNETTTYACTDQQTQVNIVDGVFGYTVSGTVTSFGSDSDDITVQLFPEGSTAPAHETVIRGNSATYSVDGVSAGTYIMYVRKNAHVTGVYTLQVRDGSITRDVAIYLYGDATGDGRTDAEDLSQLRKYMTAMDPATGVSTRNICGGADANADGVINTKDILLLRRYIQALDPDTGVSSVELGPQSAVPGAGESAKMTLSCDHVTGEPGQKVVLTVHLQENTGFSCLLVYASHAQELVLIQQINQIPERNYLSDCMILFDDTENYTATGALLTLEFAVPADAAFGTVYEISIQVCEAYDRDGSALEVQTVAGSVTVQCAHSHTRQEPLIPASCVDVGYTEGTYCDDCQVYISGHEPIQPTGVHIYSTQTEILEPTCTADGYEILSCQCGAEEKTVLGAVGHSYEPAVTAPNCQRSGFTTYTCKACHDSYTADEVAVVGHVPDEAKKENEIPATCTENGFYDRVVYCRNCGGQLSRETIAVSATGHSFGDWEIVIEPWVQPGLQQKTCGECGYTVQEQLPPTHTHAYRAILIAPTCTAWGCTLYVCDGCCDAYTTDYAPATGHHYVVCEYVEGNCVMDGYAVYTCQACGDSYTLAMMGGHQVFKVGDFEATCTEAGMRPAWYCGCCGMLFADESLETVISWEEAEISATGHVPGQWVTVKEPTQTEEGLRTLCCLVCAAQLDEEVLPTVGPIEPPTVPTEPPTVPTEPPTVPTEPPTVPTEPSTEPSVPETEPETPETEPTAPSAPETEPIGTTVPQTRPDDGGEVGGDDGEHVPDQGSAFVSVVVYMLISMGAFCVLTLKREYA